MLTRDAPSAHLWRLPLFLSFFLFSSFLPLPPLLPFCLPCASFERCASWGWRQVSTRLHTPVGDDARLDEFGYSARPSPTHLSFYKGNRRTRGKRTSDFPNLCFATGIQNRRGEPRIPSSHPLPGLKRFLVPQPGALHTSTPRLPLPFPCFRTRTFCLPQIALSSSETFIEEMLP